jgi:integrase
LRPEVQHHPALPYDQMETFIRGLRNSDAGSEMARLAVEFCILTALRIGTVRKARRPEISGDVWNAPADNMKKRFHRVPLTARCLVILERARTLAPDSEYLFAGARGEKMSPNAIDTVMKGPVFDYQDIEGRRIVLHGFRSTFADWAKETTSFPVGVVDAALSHAKQDKVAAAYHRGDLFDKRRALMATWANHAEGRSTVTEIRKSA